jgi:hypothetical protein
MFPLASVTEKRAFIDEATAGGYVLFHARSTYRVLRA